MNFFSILTYPAWDKDWSSLLHKSGSDDMENFSLQKLSKEWKERGPLFSFLRDMCNSKGERL